MFIIQQEDEYWSYELSGITILGGIMAGVSA